MRVFPHAFLVFAYWLLMLPIAASHAQEKNFFYLPDGDDARFQEISRVGNEKGWPFTVDNGMLACIYAAGKPLVMFLVEDGMEDDNITPRLRSVNVSIDPFEAIFGNMAVNDLIADDGGNNEVRMELFGAFYQVGKRLCEQPQGSHLSPGEL